MCVCVCVCVCVCLCVCVCVYILPPWMFLPSAKCPRHTWGYGSTVLCCEYKLTALCQVPSWPYLKMPYFTSKDENSSRSSTGEKTIWYDVLREKIIYIDIWYKSAQLIPTSYEKILKIRRLLLSKFFNFESSPWHKHEADLFVLVERSCIALTSCTCWCAGQKPLSKISPLTASRWVSSRGNASAIYWSLFSFVFNDWKSYLTDTGLNKFDTSSFLFPSSSSFSIFSPISFNCFQPSLFDVSMYTSKLIVPQLRWVNVRLTGPWSFEQFNKVKPLKLYESLK